MTTGSKKDWAKAKSTTERTFRKLETDFFKFVNIGDRIEGILVEKSTQRMRPNQDGSPNIIGKYRLQRETETGEPAYVEFLGGVDIDAKLQAVEESEGSFIRVTYVGQERTGGGNQMKKFDVEVAE